MSELSKLPKNKEKVFYGMVYYAGSCIGYGFMAQFNQGLQMKTSQDMFLYTASETLFMVSMAMCYFYCF